eukprot:6181047-Pleurochrysis_carterae.AAC.1
MARSVGRDADARAKAKAKGEAKVKGEARPNGHREAKTSLQVYRDVSKAVYASALAAFACFLYALCASSNLFVCIFVRLGAFCALQSPPHKDTGIQEQPFAEQAHGVLDRSLYALQQ